MFGKVEMKISMQKVGLVLALMAASRLPAADVSIPPVAHFALALSDDEINEYMRYVLLMRPRPGLDSVTVKIFPHNYVSTFMVVDFDAVERWKPGTIPALLRHILRGKQSVWVDYRFTAADSRLTFSVEKAYYDKIRLPAFFVEKMIELYTGKSSAGANR